MCLCECFFVLGGLYFGVFGVAVSFRSFAVPAQPARAPPPHHPHPTTTRPTPAPPAQQWAPANAAATCLTAPRPRRMRRRGHRGANHQRLGGAEDGLLDGRASRRGPPGQLAKCGRDGRLRRLPRRQRGGGGPAASRPRAHSQTFSIQDARHTGRRRPSTAALKRRRCAGVPLHGAVRSLACSAPYAPHWTKKTGTRPPVPSRRICAAGARDRRPRPAPAQARVKPQAAVAGRRRRPGDHTPARLASVPQAPGGTSECVPLALRQHPGGREAGCADGWRRGRGKTDGGPNREQPATGRAERLPGGPEGIRGGGARGYIDAKCVVEGLTRGPVREVVPFPGPEVVLGGSRVTNTVGAGLGDLTDSARRARNI